MEHARRLARLDAWAIHYGYAVCHVPMVRRRGWPTKSARPFHLYLGRGADAEFLASFPTLEGLESSLRARAG